MSFNGLWLEYALEVFSNYISWKDKMEAVLEDNGLKEFIDSEVPKPTSSNVALLDAWKKKVEKTRRIMLEGMKDHIVSSLHGKATLLHSNLSPSLPFTVPHIGGPIL